MFHSPLMMMPQPWQQGIQFPPFTYPLQQTRPLGCGMGMGIADVLVPYNFGMSHLGIPNPHSLPTLGLSAPSGISVERLRSEILCTNTTEDDRGPSNEDHSCGLKQG